MKALPHLALLIAFFAILKFSDIKKGLIILLIFSLGILVNLLLLGFKIFALQNSYVLLLITIGTLLFSIWNFGFSPGTFRRRTANMSSRYLVAFILGLIHGIYVYFLFSDFMSSVEIINIFGIWAGLFLAFIAILIIDYIFLWILITFLRIKEQSWLLVVTGIAIGLASGVFLTF